MCHRGWNNRAATANRRDAVASYTSKKARPVRRAGCRAHSGRPRMAENLKPGSPPPTGRRACQWKGRAGEKTRRPVAPAVAFWGEAGDAREAKDRCRAASELLAGCLDRDECGDP